MGRIFLGNLILLPFIIASVCLPSQVFQSVCLPAISPASDARFAINGMLWYSSTGGWEISRWVDKGFWRWGITRWEIFWVIQFFSPVFFCFNFTSVLFCFNFVAVVFCNRRFPSCNLKSRRRKVNSRFFRNPAKNQQNNTDRMFVMLPITARAPVFQ